MGGSFDRFNKAGPTNIEFAIAYEVFDEDWLASDPSPPFEPYVHVERASRPRTTPPSEVIMEM